jgi:hypothetical protein
MPFCDSLIAVQAAFVKASDTPIAVANVKRRFPDFTIR